MSNNHLPASVQALFQQLADQHGLQIQQAELSSSFDQLAQVATTKNLSIRFLRDRGDESLEISCGTEWFSLDLVRLVLLDDQPKDAPADLQKDASFLRQHFHEIEHLFCADNRTETLHRLSAMRVKKARCMFPNAFADGDG